MDSLAYDMQEEYMEVNNQLTISERMNEKRTEY